MNTNMSAHVDFQQEAKRYLTIWIISAMCTLGVVLGVNLHFGYNLAQAAGLFDMAVMLTLAMLVIDVGRVTSAYYKEVSQQRAVAGLQRETEQSQLYHWLYVGGTAVSIIIFVASILNMANVSMKNAASASAVTKVAEAGMAEANRRVIDSSKYANINVSQVEAELAKAKADLESYLAQPAKNMGGKNSGYTIGGSLSVHPFYQKQYGAEIERRQQDIANITAKLDGAMQYQGGGNMVNQAIDQYKKVAEEEGRSGSILSGLTNLLNSLFGLFGAHVTEFVVFAVVAIAIYILNEMFLRLSVTNVAYGKVQLDGIEPVNTKATVATIAEASKLARQFGMFTPSNQVQPISTVMQPAPTIMQPQALSAGQLTQAEIKARNLRALQLKARILEQVARNQKLARARNQELVMDNAQPVPAPAPAPAPAPEPAPEPTLRQVLDSGDKVYSDQPLDEPVRIKPKPNESDYQPNLIFDKVVESIKGGGDSSIKAIMEHGVSKTTATKYRQRLKHQGLID